MTHKVLASCAVVAVLLAARAACAQTQLAGQADSPSWLKDRRYAEGIGIRTGDLEIHPGIAGEVGYDSNWLLRTDRVSCPGGAGGKCDNGPPVISAAEFRVTPSLSVSTLGPQRSDSGGDVSFRAGVSATFREFVGLSSDSTGNSDISQQNSAIPSIAADARFEILAGHPVGGSVFANYARVVQPNETSTDPDLSFNRDDLGIGAELALQPGSGTLDWHFGYQLRTELFEEGQALGFDNLTHLIYTRGRWKFRPRTALLYDGSLGFVTYTRPEGAAVQGLVGSTPIRTHIGLTGLITDRFAATALIGWGASFYDTTATPQQPQFDGPIGQAEVKWFLAGSPGIAALNQVSLSLSSITLGYNRDFQNSYLANYYGSDRGYLRFAYFFAGRALVSLEGGFGAVEYPTMFWLPPSTPTVQVRHAPFTDWRADATLFAEYRFSDTVGVNTTLRYTTNISNELVPDAPPPGTSVFGMGWNRFEAFVGVRWFM
jgi:hypothetical protein